MNTLKYIQDCCPYAFNMNKIPDNVVDFSLYRMEDKWRTAMIRTYLRKLFMNIDRKDFIDKRMMIKNLNVMAKTYSAIKLSELFLWRPTLEIT